MHDAEFKYKKLSRYIPCHPQYMTHLQKKTICQNVDCARSAEKRMFYKTLKVNEILKLCITFSRKFNMSHQWQFLWHIYGSKPWWSIVEKAKATSVYKWLKN